MVGGLLGEILTPTYQLFQVVVFGIIVTHDNFTNFLGPTMTAICFTWNKRLSRLELFVIHRLVFALLALR